MDTNFYLDLIPSDNYTKPKFMSLVKSVLEGAVDTGAIDETIEDSFDVYNAAGVQLDIIGELVGISRLLPFTLDSGTREMDDEEYRLMILLKIAKNNWDGTNEGVRKAYASVLNGYDVNVIDHQDMTLTVVFFGAVSTRTVSILANMDFLLRPAGVLINLEISNDVESPIYCGTGISGISALDGVTMVEQGEGLFVGDVQEMYVSDLHNMTVRNIEH